MSGGTESLGIPESPHPPAAPVQEWHGRHQHSVLFYIDDPYLLKVLANTTGKALRAGQAVIVIATGQHRAGLLDQLRARGVNAALAADEGRFLLLDAAQVLSTVLMDGKIDAEAFEKTFGSLVLQARAAAGGDSSGVLMFGELVSLLCDRGQHQEAVRLEQLWNELARKVPFVLECAYPMRNFSRPEDGESFHRVCAEHTGVIPTEHYSLLASEQERLRKITDMQRQVQELDFGKAQLRKARVKMAEINSRNEQLREEVRRRERAEEGLRVLSGRLLALRDDERRRVARELHESTAQLLAALGINLRMVEAERELLTPRTTQFLDRSSQLVQELIEQIRALSYLLHPPTLDDMGLRSALEWYVKRFSQKSRVQVSMDFPDTFGRLPRAVEIAIFRVVQESLSNVERHSGSSTASVCISVNPRDVLVEVRDAGRGMTPEESAAVEHDFGRCVGITAMRERVAQLGGKLMIHSHRGSTVLRARLPRTS